MESSKNFRVIFLAIMMSMILGVNAAEARPSNDKIIQWLNKHLANVAGGVDEEEGVSCRPSGSNWLKVRESTTTYETYHYTFTTEDNVLVVEEVQDSEIDRDRCDGGYTKRTTQNLVYHRQIKVDLSTATTINKNQISIGFKDVSLFPTSVPLEGESIIVGRFNSDVELADKVRRALNDLILNNGGAEPLY